MSTILVTGVAGSLARLTALELVARGHEVVGIDYRRRPKDFPSSVQFYQGNYNKTRVDDVFRRHEPQVVLHLGRVGHLSVHRNKRFNLNVLGSARIMDLSVKFEVEQLVVLSTFHIYGAHPFNHIPIFEDEPLRALQTFPKLYDVVQLDNQAVNWTYRHRRLRTIVLRPTNVVGAHIRNTISNLLRRRRIPYVAGFNPMWQFVHETDLLRAILAVIEQPGHWGTYNIAGRDSVPLLEALKLSEARLVPVPEALLRFSLEMSADARQSVPRYLVDFFKYPVIVSDDRFRQDFGFEPQIGVTEAIQTCVTRMPVSAGLA